MRDTTPARRPTLPKGMTRLLARLPAYPPSLLFAAVLDQALGRRIGSEVLHALHGRRLSICVVDAGFAFYFGACGGAFHACRPGPVDLTISADAYDFLLLILRREDPDTLFFSRRLLMEGDTELGLLAKNTLDGLEPPVWVERLLRPIMTRMATGSAWRSD